MAKATKIFKNEAVVTPITYKQVDAGVTLELTKEEAQFLYDVTEFIGGHPSKTRRKHSNTIRDALTGAGFSSSTGYDVRTNTTTRKDSEGSIYFNEPGKSQTTVEVRLRKDQATAILDLTAYIGGCTGTSRRKLTDEVGKILRDAGVQQTPYPREDMSGAVTFNSKGSVGTSTGKGVEFVDMFDKYMKGTLLPVVPTPYPFSNQALPSFYK